MNKVSLEYLQKKVAKIDYLISIANEEHSRQELKEIKQKVQGKILDLKYMVTSHEDKDEDSVEVPKYIQDTYINTEGK